MVSATDPYRGVCRIDRAAFTALVKQMAAPSVIAERDPGEYWDAIWTQYHADPLFVAAIFNHESNMGKNGTATQTHSWGNTRTPNFDATPVGTVAGRSGTFPVWRNWLDGCISTVARLTDPSWVYAKENRSIGGVFTIEPSWAPAGDMNDPAGYLRSVLDFMNAHQTIGDAPMAADDPKAQWVGTPNFDSGRGGVKIDRIILHTTEGGFDGSVGWLQNPQAQASAHYVVSADGSRIVQMVREADTAWAAGVYAWNQRSINIEQEGYAGKGGFSDGLYQTVGGLVARIAARHGIPVDRAHIIGHMDVPAPNNHTDPGPKYDFNRVLGGANVPAAKPTTRKDPATGFVIQGGMLAYYQLLESKLGPDETLLLVGRPISNEFVDTDGVTRQAFERQVWEWRKGSRPQQFDILGLRLGVDWLKAHASAKS